MDHSMSMFKSFIREKINIIKIYFDFLLICIRPRPFSLEKPKVLQFPVIDICNSRCQMCGIWKNQSCKMISIEELSAGLDNSLFSEVTTVGINGGEPTLRDDLILLVQTIFERLPKLKNITFITNGYDVDKVCQVVKDLSALVKNLNGNLHVMLSLDGYGVVHDRVRGIDGFFDNTQRVIDNIQRNQIVDNFSISCTVIRQNVFYLSEILNFCINKKLYIKFRLGIPHQRLYTSKLKEPYDLNEEEVYELIEFLENLCIHYEKNESQKLFYFSLIRQVLHGEPRRAGCLWQHRGVTITAKGELLYCAVHSRTLLANIADGGADTAYFSNIEHLSEILRSKCPSCRHDYLGFPSRKDCIRLLLRKFYTRSGFKSSLKRFEMANKVNGIIRERQFNKHLHALKNAGVIMRQVPLPAKTPIKKHVLICGWYGTETLGDMGILAGVIQSVRDCLGQDTNFYVASLNPYVTCITRLQMPELTGVQIVDPIKAIVLARSMDYVMFGGGPIMALDALAEMEVIFEVAKQAGVQTVIAGCGVGPLGNKSHNACIARLLHMADVRIFRDDESKKNAQVLGVDTSCDQVAEDPAFTWLGAVSCGLPRKSSSEERKTLLLGLREFPYKEYAHHITTLEALNVRDRFEAAVVASLEGIAAQRSDVLILPLPMCTNHFGNDDRWFYRRLLRKANIPSRALNLSLLGRQLPALEYCRAFASAHAVVAMRFHSLVFSIGLGVPVVALDYTLGKGKVHSLAKKNNIPLLTLGEFTASDLIQHVNILLDSTSSQDPPYNVRFGDVLRDALMGNFIGSNTCRADV
jgi:sulfatase maturation enzyme AslB (radical SAM superfamily)/polysaccharide pyruvyl transferase WcaK-like protein